MVRTLAKIALAVGVLLLLLLALLAAFLPRLIESDALQTTLRARAAEALGAPVDWTRLEVALLPPRLILETPRLVAESAGAEGVRLSADSVDLRPSWGGLLRRRLEIDSLVLKGLELVAIRTADGLQLPFAETGSEGSVPEDARAGDVRSAPPLADASPSEAPADDEEALPFALDLRRLVIEGSRIVLRDRTLAEPIDWRFEALRLEARGSKGSDPIAIDATATLHSGAREVGALATTGTLTRTGLYDLEITIEELLLRELSAYLPGQALEGRLSGRISIDGAGASPSRTRVDLRVQEIGFIGRGLDLGGELALQAHRRETEPVDFVARLELAGDAGTVRVEGRLDPDGVLDLAGEVERVDLGMASSFLPGPEMRMGGFATGKIRLLGAATAPERFGFDARIEAGQLQIPDYAVEGPFSLKLDVKEPLSARPSGTLDLDLTAARVRYRDEFVKRAGMRAEMVSRFSPDAKGETVFESRIKLHDVDEILLQGLMGESTSVVVTTPTFELEGWAEVFPALAPYAPAGPIAMEGVAVELVDGVPMRFGGRLQLGGVGLTLPAVGRVRLRGRLLGEGTTLRSEGLEMRLGGVTLAVAGRIGDPLDAAPYELEVRSMGTAEVNALLHALGSNRDTLFGPLALDGRISGQARDAADFRRSVEGHLAFTIGKEGGGRLRGVPILQKLLDRIPIVGDAARLTRTLRGGDPLQSYLSERFEIIEGRFELGGGRVEARPLRLAYRGYEVHLSGPLRLEDLSIDMKGEILLKSDLVSTLVGSSRDSAASGRDPIRVPLARVTNTLADPKLKMTPETLAAVPRLLIQAGGLDALSTGVGKALGSVLGGAREGN